MTEQDINLNHAQARGQADELRALAEELREILSEYHEVLHSLESVWSGPSTRQYLDGAQTKTRNLGRVPGRLDELAQAIDKTAALYRQAEMQKLRAKRSIR